MKELDSYKLLEGNNLIHAPTPRTIVDQIRGGKYDRRSKLGVANRTDGPSVCQVQHDNVARRGLGCVQAMPLGLVAGSARACRVVLNCQWLYYSNQEGFGIFLGFFAKELQNKSPMVKMAVGGCFRNCFLQNHLLSSINIFSFI